MSAEHVQTANAAYAAGLCVVPPSQNGSKAPVGSWKRFTKERPPQQQMDKWYGTATGVGLICGAVSGNLELLEFDDYSVYEYYKSAANESGIEYLVQQLEAGYLESSPNGGIHWLYLCEEIAGNTKLARRPTLEEEKLHVNDNVRVLIETRGEGGYVIIAPSNGTVHPTGREYKLLSGSIATIPTISPEERGLLWDLARTFDAMPMQEASVNGNKEAVQGRPGDIFNSSVDWNHVLSPHGWRKIFSNGSVDYWRRPGKDIGISASTNWADTDYFIVFSTSTQFEDQRAYTKFSAYTLLNHGGSFSEAAKQLLVDGYGAPVSPDIYPNGHGPPPRKEYPFTDLGNAERLVDLYGHDLLFCYPWKDWLTYDSTRFGHNQDGLVYRKASATVRGMYQEGADLATKAADTPDDQERIKLSDKSEAIQKHARRSEERRRIESMIALAQSREGIPVLPAQLDKDPWLLNAPNGTIDLRKGLKRDHDRADLLTKSIAVPYDPHAPCPLWQQFLSLVFNGDDELINFIQRAVGYSLTGIVSAQVMFVLYGTGRNGKSTFLETLMGLLGDYATKAPADLLMVRRGEVHPTEKTTLYGARFVPAVETEEGRKLNETGVKELTGGDTIKARRMHENFWSFRPTHHLWLATNHKPMITGTDLGIWRRIRLIPFAVTIPDALEDESFPERLKDEWSGILAWAVRGCLEWQKIGLYPPDAVRNATAEYKSAMDIIGDFLEEHCVVQDGAKEPASNLFSEFQTWAKNAGEKAISKMAFGQKLADRDFRNKRGAKGKHFWWGLRLKTDDDPTIEMEMEMGDIGAIGATGSDLSPLWNEDIGPKGQNRRTMSPTGTDDNDYITRNDDLGVEDDDIEGLNI